MGKRLSLHKLIVLSVLLGSCLAVSAAAQTTVDGTATWDPPTYGATVVQYMLQHSVNGGMWQDVANVAGTSHTFPLTVGESHRIRVAGITSDDRLGPFSLPCEPVIPGDEVLPPPCQPGDPVGQIVQ